MRLLLRRFEKKPFLNLIDVSRSLGEILLLTKLDEELRGEEAILTYSTHFRVVLRLFDKLGV